MLLRSAVLLRSAALRAWDRAVARGEEGNDPEHADLSVMILAQQFRRQLSSAVYQWQTTSTELKTSAVALQ